MFGSIGPLACLLTVALASWLPDPLGSSNHYWERSIERRHPNESSTWPYGPFKTRGRDIINTRNETITWAGVNWPMSGETMIPEGLEWKSAAEILDEVASVGWNYIRMGYAIQMVDEIYQRNGADVPLEVALTMGLGYVNGSKVTQQILERNPTWTAQTTRFEIWSDIADLALERGIFISPDVHVGKAQWCCSHSDGNSWFDDLYFNASDWRRGLSYVASWAHSHPNVVSMSLRNELRDSYNTSNTLYNWETLVGNMSAAADAIHASNSDILITWSGMQFDQDLSALTAGSNLLTAPCYKCAAIRDAHRRDPVYFDLGEHAWADKIVWELHLYSMSEDLDTGSCDIIHAELYRNGFNALGIPAPSACETIGGCEPATRLTPVIFSEFGHAQDETLYNDTLQTCLQAYTKEHGVSWMVWGLAGSYRIRSGVQGFNDTWGLTNEDWTGWQDPDTIENWWKPWLEGMNATKKG